MSDLIVRAADVGYGHVKFTYGRDLTIPPGKKPRPILTDSFPSQSPTTDGGEMAVSGVMNKSDTFLIPIENRIYEVGRSRNLPQQPDI